MMRFDDPSPDRSNIVGGSHRFLIRTGKAVSPALPAGPRNYQAERRRSRTYPAWGCHASPVLKTSWATGPVPLRALQ